MAQAEKGAGNRNLGTGATTCQDEEPGPIGTNGTGDQRQLRYPVESTAAENADRNGDATVHKEESTDRPNSPFIDKGPDEREERLETHGEEHRQPPNR